MSKSSGQFGDGSGVQARDTFDRDETAEFENQVIVVGRVQSPVVRLVFEIEVGVEIVDEAAARCLIGVDVAEGRGGDDFERSVESSSNDAATGEAALELSLPRHGKAGVLEWSNGQLWLTGLVNGHDDRPWSLRSKNHSRILPFRL